jgi:hypothetical protein
MPNQTGQSTTRSALVEKLTAELTTDAVRRWGRDRATELATTIASTAETLALVALVSVGHDDAEPDFGDVGG